MARLLNEIAKEIRTNWKNPNYAAKPYLDAMSLMTTVEKGYMADDGKGIILYFLSNAASWRGDVSRRVKTELKAMCK